MKNKKYIVFLLLLFITTFLAVFLFSGRKKGRLEPGEAPESIPKQTSFENIDTALPRPFFKNQPLYTGPAVFETPSSLPLVKIDQTPNIDYYGGVISGYFKFTAKPKLSSGTKGSYITWSEKTQTLSVSSSGLSYSYFGPGEKTVPGQPGDFTGEALNILKSLSIPPKGFELSKLKTDYIKLINQDPKKISGFEDADIIQVNFDITCNGFPVGFEVPGNTFASLGFDRNLNLVQMRFYFPPQISTTEDDNELKSSQKAITALQSGRGFVANIYTQSTSSAYLYIDKAPDSITVTDIKTGYYYDPKSEYLVPVFYVYGKGKAVGHDVTTISVTNATE